MGYGVIGNTTVSGTVILGSSPGSPADRKIESLAVQRSFGINTPPLCSGLARRPLKAVAPVRIRSGVREEGARHTVCAGPLPHVRSLVPGAVSSRARAHGRTKRRAD